MLDEHTLPSLAGGKARPAVILLHGVRDGGAGLIGLGGCWREGLPEAGFVELSRHTGMDRRYPGCMDAF